MTSIVLGPGAHGGTVERVQRALLAAGFDPKGADGQYGSDTSAAVRSFQGSCGLPPTGVVDDSTWQALLHEDPPTTDVRSLELTATFEGHGYSLAIGNFDGAWLTWGIIGFTLKHGEVQRIILEVNDAHPAILSNAFQDKAQALLKVMRSSPEAQEGWANSVSSNGRLVEPWKSGFACLGSFEEVRQIQRQHARNDYFVPSVKTAKQYGLKSKLGLALCFDIHVQNGGIKKAARVLVEESLSREPVSNEEDLRRVIATAVANVARPAFQEDVRSRKLTLATGQGTVHGHSFILQNWGLGEELASELI